MSGMMLIMIGRVCERIEDSWLGNVHVDSCIELELFLFAKR